VDESAFDNHVRQPYTVQFVEEVQPLIDHELDTTRGSGRFMVWPNEIGMKCSERDGRQLAEYEK